MRGKIRDAQSTKKIRQVSSTRRIDPADVAKALGAQTVEYVPQDNLDPVSFFALHERMSSELVSTGGRPGRAGVSGRRKVPMSDQEWSDLEQLSNILDRLGLHVSPGQVAGFLLESSLNKMKAEITALEADAAQVFEAAASSKEPLADLEPIAEELLRKMKLRKIQELMPGLGSVKES